MLNHKQYNFVETSPDPDQSIIEEKDEGIDEERVETREERDTSKTTSKPDFLLRTGNRIRAWLGMRLKLTPEEIRGFAFRLDDPVVKALNNAKLTTDCGIKVLDRINRTVIDKSASETDRQNAWALLREMNKKDLPSEDFKFRLKYNDYVYANGRTWNFFEGISLIESNKKNENIHEKILEKNLQDHGEQIAAVIFVSSYGNHDQNWWPDLYEKVVPGPYDHDGFIEFVQRVCKACEEA